MRNFFNNRHTPKSMLIMLIVAGSVSSFAVPPKPAAIKVTTGTFKKWEYSPNGVFGIGAVTNTQNRSFVKITRVNDGLVKIEKYNTVAILQNKTLVYFVNGTISKVIEINQWGEEYSQSYFTDSSKGVFFVTQKVRGVNSYLPCKKARQVYINNLETEIRYYDDSGNACTCNNGAAVIKYQRYTGDKKLSLIKEMSFYNEEDSPVVSTTYDCHKIVYEYDEKGSETSEKYYGVDAKPVANRYGIYGIIFHDGLMGNIGDEDYVDDHGKLINNAFGVARVEGIFDEKSLMTMQTRYNASLSITRASASGDGVAAIKYKHDNAGNEIEKTFYDEKIKPLNNTVGYQKLASKYSQRNMLTDESYFDANGLAFSNSLGVHHYHYGKDSIGRIVSIKYFDKGEQACLDNLDRAYEKRYQYDSLGRRISESYWDKTGLPMNRWNGYHESRYKFNDDGLPVEIAYLDDNGGFVKTGNGFSLQKITYGGLGRIASRSYFDGETPIVNNAGTIHNYHSIYYTYDASGRTISIEYRDTANNPVNAVIELGINIYRGCTVTFFYEGSRVTREKIYSTAARDTPLADIDCLRSRYISPVGTGTIAPPVNR